MIELLYQDEHYIAVYKPSGLLTHRSPIDRRETQFALQQARDRVGQRVYPVHRLDKATSGVLLFALSSESAHRMMRLFSAGCVDKQYLAIVRGYTSESDRIDYPLAEQRDRVADRLADPNPTPQPAVTCYRRLAIAEVPVPVGRYATARYSLIELSPKHGRKHQLRRHMKHIFHPIVGDTTHGDGHHNRFFREHFQSHRLLLSATRIHFVHPFGQEGTAIIAPPDGSFADVAKWLGWESNLAP